MPMPPRPPRRTLHHPSLPLSSRSLILSASTPFPARFHGVVLPLDTTRFIRSRPPGRSLARPGAEFKKYLREIAGMVAFAQGEQKAPYIIVGTGWFRPKPIKLRCCSPSFRQEDSETAPANLTNSTSAHAPRSHAGIGMPTSAYSLAAASGLTHLTNPRNVCSVGLSGRAAYMLFSVLTTLR